MKKIIFILVVITLTVGACDMRPANTTTTTFVVWDQEILASVGIVIPPAVTAADLIRQEGSPTMSASQLAAFEANPNLQGSSPTRADGPPPMFAGAEAVIQRHAQAAQEMRLAFPEPTSTRPTPSTRPAPPKY